MFTVIKAHYAGNEKSYVEGACLAADSKPTDGIANGSIIVEIDTGKIFMFNETGSAWAEV